MSRRLNIKYYVEPDPAALARRAAQYFMEMVSEAVASQGRARIAISGGSTPKAAFQLLADPEPALALAHALGQARPLLGGRAGVPPDHADSNYRMTREAHARPCASPSGSDPSHGRRTGA